MRTTLILATFVATLLAIFAAIDIQAQTGGRPAAVGGPVAVIDLRYIIKNNSGFKSGEERMKADMEAADASLKKERSRLQSLSEKLKTYKPGSPEYKKLEEDLAQQSASLQVRVKIMQKDFQEKQSKLFYGIYREINDAVKYYSDRHGINLVLQFDGDKIDGDNPQSVNNALNNMVVYQRGVDITPLILEELNRNAAASRTRAPGSTPPR